MAPRSIGQQFIELASVDSTNKYAAEQLALRKLRHGAVILAHEQTAGRGQRGRVWRSGGGLDLTASVVLMPQRMRVAGQAVLAKMAALAVHDVVADAFRQAGLATGPVRIKWPNDVLVDRRKISGILIKNEVVGTLVQSCVVGIGLNVNNTDLEADIQATSLRLETGREHDRRAVLEALCDRLEAWWQRVEAEDPAVGQAYADLLWSRGRFAEFQLDGEPFTGRPMDVDEEGRLLVEDGEGRVQAYGTERLRFAPR